MPEALARRTGIELVRTGTWGTSTGSWTPTRQDILAAVEAQKCPAVRRPRLKLGHTDERFNGDGQPSLGWFENLRAGDDGDTLVADQVALPWLASVQAAAYPDRSIEGTYRMRCGLGHEHPFAITAVALLGVTPPAVSTLKSVQDLPEMLGIAADGDEAEGAEHVQATVLAAAESEPPVPPAEPEPLSPAVTEPPPELPAAEPEPVINPDPKEDLVSTELSGVRSRLGLADDADEQAILSALDELKATAEKTPEPTPEMVAASAAATKKAEDAEAEKDELRKEVTVLASQVKSMSDELSTSKAAQAAVVKASVFDAAIKDGKLKPADRAQWEADYDEAPGAITRVLASIAAGTAVPVMASGTVGSAEPTGDDDEFEKIMARLDGPSAAKAV